MWPGPQPRQVLAAAVVNRGIIRNTQRRLCFLRGKPGAEPLGMPFHNQTLQQGGGFAGRIFDHRIPEQGVDILLASGNQTRGNVMPVVGEIKLEKDRKPQDDQELNRDHAPRGTT